MKLWPAIRAPFDALLDQPVQDLALRLTLLILILYGSSDQWLDVPLKILCGFMLLSPAHLRSFGFWTAVAAFVWWLNATDWLWIDNHKYLMGYWVLACAVCVSSENPTPGLVWNARIFVGLTFAFATVWKLLVGQYLNGDFLYYTLLLDDRMEVIARLAAGVSVADLDQAFALEGALATHPGEGIQATLPDSPRLELVAQLMSWWTLLVEGAVAFCFLWPRQGIIRRVGDLVLICFILATYIIVPVLGFGYTLALLGLTACPPEARRMRAAYLIALAALQAGTLPWTGWVT